MINVHAVQLYLVYIRKSVLYKVVVSVHDRQLYLRVIKGYVRVILVNVPARSKDHTTDEVAGP